MIEVGFRNNLAHRRPLLEPPTQRHRDRAAHAHQEGHHRASRGWCGEPLTRTNAGIPGDGGWPWMDQQWRVVHRQQQGEDGGVQEAVHNGQSPRHWVPPSQPRGDQGWLISNHLQPCFCSSQRKAKRSFLGSRFKGPRFRWPCFTCVASHKILFAMSPNFYWMRILLSFHSSIILAAPLPPHECGWHLWDPL